MLRLQLSKDLPRANFQIFVVDCWLSGWADNSVFFERFWWCGSGWQGRKDSSSEDLGKIRGSRGYAQTWAAPWTVDQKNSRRLQRAILYADRLLSSFDVWSAPSHTSPRHTHYTATMLGAFHRIPHVIYPRFPRYRSNIRRWYRLQNTNNADSEFKTHTTTTEPASVWIVVR